MSDDDFLAESPYDEWEEMLWDADPGPSLADDLAQHAAYSPVWQDDPVGELDTYHSDWEYYSDDYYDDDPAILKNDPANGDTPRTRKSAKIRARSGTKRKLDDMEQASESIEDRSLRSSLRGTVWARNVSPEPVIFQSGHDDKVALLTDWRKRFRMDVTKPYSPALPKLKRDESWANDLSLADMGLMRTQKGLEAGQDVEDVESDANEDERDEADENLPSEEHLRSDGEPQNVEEHDHLSTTILNQNSEAATDANLKLDAFNHGTRDTDRVTEERVSKRARTTSVSASWDAHDLCDNHDQDLPSATYGVGHFANTSTKQEAENEITHGRRKRKLSTSEGEDSNNSRLSESRHVKRLAPSKSKVNQVDKTETNSQILNSSSIRTRRS